MALNPPNSSNLEQLALKGLIMSDISLDFHFDTARAVRLSILQFDLISKLVCSLIIGHRCTF